MKEIRNPQLDLMSRNQLIYAICYWNFELFVELFFEEHCCFPFSDMHRKFFAMESDPTRRGRRDVIAAPRGHAKTTIMALIKVVHAICYGYHKYIMIIGHSTPEADSKVKDVLSELENNELLKSIYGELAPKRGQVGYGTKMFITINGVKVESKSRGKQVRGAKHGNHRPDLIILDDIESPEKVQTAEQRKKTQTWLEKDILKLGRVDGNANVIIIGTCLHPEALLPSLLRSPGWDGQKYQSVISFATHENLWVQWRELYTDLADPDRKPNAQAFYEANEAKMIEGTRVLWPEGESYLRLMKLIVDEGKSSFQSEKQNDPYDPELQIFNMKEARHFDLEYADGELIGLRWLDKSNRFIPISDLSIIAYHDPAMSENKINDFAALVVGGMDSHGYIYVLDAYVERVPPSRQLLQALAFQEQWGFDRLYVEDNNFQGLLKKDYRQLIENQRSSLRVSGVTQTKNKLKRIANLEPMIANGQLLFRSDISHRLLTQFELFPTDEHDDGPDAVCGVVEKLRKRGFTEI